ncbi:GlxA family transcriptional regulator [Nocardiopsis aegyptia]|uniref:Transcriptional regulator GlxA family with amidase domain n=1 Tax=Nocardiopsis aegyptia TaxID=220378 RepID=A0A7Z0EJG5_9ACTN|nr:helix-turn-helix domain-containing protein [Nocardiopsis aegyptia]NYJ32383.1 transcriptional regulator GlxA family with amidase domain [Nocardiopsis aegyptia]
MSCEGADWGLEALADAARLSVMPLEREGGQAQFVVRRQETTPAGSRLEPLLRWMADHADRPLTVAEIAVRTGTSPRTLTRRFREQTGTTPLQWLHRQRVHQAQHLLETTDHPVERIAERVGFGSPTAFRDRFRRVAGTSPQAYRRAFQGHR